MGNRLIIDTNILIRLFIKDGNYLEAKRILDSAEEILVPDMVVYEMIYVLQTLYNVPREEILKCFKLFDLEKVELENGVLIRTAFDYYMVHSKLSFADCYLLAKWMLSSDNLATLDKNLTEKIADYNKHFFISRRNQE